MVQQSALYHSGKSSSPVPELYNDVYGDFEIAWITAFQWWRVDKMRQDWIAEVRGEEESLRIIERAYHDFQARIKPFEPPLPFECYKAQEALKNAIKRGALPADARLRQVRGYLRLEAHGKYQGLFTDAKLLTERLDALTVGNNKTDLSWLVDPCENSPIK